MLLNPIALAKAKIVYNFGLCKCNRVKYSSYHCHTCFSRLHHKYNVSSFSSIRLSKNLKFVLALGYEPMNGFPRNWHGQGIFFTLTSFSRLQDNLLSLCPYFKYNEFNQLINKISNITVYTVLLMPEIG